MCGWSKMIAELLLVLLLLLLCTFEKKGSHVVDALVSSRSLRQERLVAARSPSSPIITPLSFGMVRTQIGAKQPPSEKSQRGDWTKQAWFQGVIAQTMKSCTISPPPFTMAATTAAIAASLGSFASVAQAAATSSSSMASVSTTANIASTSGVSLETHVWTALGHLGLDVASFVAPPSMLIVRALAIVGRLCSLRADYVPDHVIFPEEVLFQGTMLCLAVLGLCQAAFLPVVAATVPTVPWRAARAYCALFRPSGVSWPTYKALSACAIDWITLENSSSNNNESGGINVLDYNDTQDYVYWVYSGTVLVESEQGRVETVTSDSMDRAAFRDQAGCRLIGEGRLVSSKSSPNTASAFRLRATDTPTTILLRLHVPSVQQCTQADARLAEALRTLVFDAMQCKLQHATTPHTSPVDGPFPNKTTALA
jgi:hypothetical protein